MQTITLNNGVEMPRLGFGVWQIPDDEATTAVTTALAAGYRSIDTARIYDNERGVGRAVQDSDIPRDELFITTKLWNADHEHDAALRAFDGSLNRLGLDYVDLYLMHWPVPSQDRYVDAWRAMEKVHAEGRAKAIGVSNFTQETLARLLRETDVVPAVNQIELHPYLVQREMRAFHAEHGIATEDWSPLGQGKGLLDDPVLEKLAQRYGKSPAQVVLRWHLQLGDIVIPKSVTPSRIQENIDVFDFELAAEDVEQITGLDRAERFGPNPATFDWLG
ncbi:MAG TPA: aldo/keto reductase [Pseudonocardiaceae bacterium]|jgi:2,5-diketo-D-gluconate reductase A|nr:aldo/keto reductase [Pseudonocardiaceae bacterium]